jgi:hypothetical protein
MKISLCIGHGWLILITIYKLTLVCALRFPHNKTLNRTEDFKMQYRKSKEGNK